MGTTLLEGGPTHFEEEGIASFFDWNKRKIEKEGKNGCRAQKEEEKNN